MNSCDDDDSNSGSESGMSLERSTSSESHTDSDDAAEVQECVSLGKLSKIDPTCPFVVTTDGFLYCTLCGKGVVAVKLCKNHIMRNHNSSKLWLRPMLDDESSGTKSIDELVAFYSLLRGVEPRKPFDRFDIFDGFQCSACGETSRSRTVILRHVKKCQNGCIRSVKCQQPLAWADPRNPTHNFQRIFPVKEEERELQSFPDSCFQESQKIETAGTLVDSMSLGMLLNWTTLHSKCFKDTPDSVFRNISEAEGREEWLPKVKALSANYFQKIHQTILEVESQGCQRDLCRIRMHSKHGIVPARGFYWLGSSTIVKYTSVLSRLMSFAARLCSMQSAAELSIPLLHQQLEIFLTEQVTIVGTYLKFTDHLAGDRLADSLDISKFHAALFAIVSQKVTDKNGNDLKYVLMAFVRSACHAHVQQHRPKNVTALISALKYIIRGCVLIEAKAIFSQNAHISSDRLDSCSLLDIAQRDSATLFDKICGLQNICFSVTVAESEVSISSDYKTVNIGCQKTVHLKNIQTMVNKLFAQAKRSMEDLLPMDGYLTDYKCGHHPESPDNTIVGFSIFNDVVPLQSIKEYIQRRRLHESAAHMTLFLQQAENFQKLFAMLIMLVPGSPTRGVEQSNWLICNTSDSKRNVFYDVAKQLVYVSYTKSKNSRQRQKSKVHIKYFNEELSLLAFNYFGIVRPIERFFARHLNLPSVSTEAFKTSMFVLDGRQCLSSEFSAISRQFCLQHGLPALGLRDLRQTLIAFSRAWLAEFSRQSTVFEFVERHVAAQSAHAVSTHRKHYGGSRQIEDETGFFIASCAHMWLMGANVPAIGTKVLPAIAQVSQAAGTTAIMQRSQTTLPQVSSSSGIKPESFEDYFLIARQLLVEFKMYSTVQFRTQLQATAVVRSLQRQEFLYIAPCGVGKSLCFWLPMLREKCTTVLFLPYALLRRNVHLQAETMGISSVLFEKTVIVNFEAPPRLLICAVEQIRTMSGVLTQLARKNLLARIIIDEIQCVFTEEFRAVMGDFRVWRAQLAFGT